MIRLTAKVLSGPTVEFDLESYEKAISFMSSMSEVISAIHGLKYGSEVASLVPVGHSGQTFQVIVKKAATYAGPPRANLLVIFTLKELESEKESLCGA